ncbi:LysR family transcriptional regulator [Amycolatopsis sp. NPDC098790]|uniref:LysR family transcriptional regulator n=1 Tax=Amycolatopsis sp. NPDC098790 TaxID=3363939 RepID=UPI0037F1C9B9
MLDLRHLRALDAVVATGSVRGAATRLGYTPSAISQHLGALERRTGAVLFEPAGRGIRPTAAGRLLAGHAAALLERMAEAEAALAALTAGELGVLRLASFATAGAELVPPALARLRAELPGLEIGLRSAETDRALGLLRQGELDLAVIEAHAVPDPGDGLTYHRLLTDPFRLVLPRGHRLAARRTIALADAAAEPWIDLKCEVGCCRSATTAAFAEAGFEPRRVIEADEYWPAQGFVAAGLGLALMPALALGVQHTGVVVRRLPRAAQPVRHVLAATRPAVERTAPVRAMVAALLAEAAG